MLSADENTISVVGVSAPASAASWLRSGDERVARAAQPFGVVHRARLPSGNLRERLAHSGGGTETNPRDVARGGRQADAIARRERIQKLRQLIPQVPFRAGPQRFVLDDDQNGTGGTAAPAAISVGRKGCRQCARRRRRAAADTGPGAATSRHDCGRPP